MLLGQLRNQQLWCNIRCCEQIQVSTHSEYVLTNDICHLNPSNQTDTNKIWNVVRLPVNKKSLKIFRKMRTFILHIWMYRKVQLVLNYQEYIWQYLRLELFRCLHTLVMDIRLNYKFTYIEFNLLSKLLSYYFILNILMAQNEMNTSIYSFDLRRMKVLSEVVIQV